MTSEQRRRYEAARTKHRQNREDLVVATEHSAAVVSFVVEIPAAINQLVFAIEDWQPESYASGDVRLYKGIPYKCVQDHDSTANPGWTPDSTPALWMQYHGTSPETARPYIQPLGAHDAYQVDEYAIEGGVTYRCKVAATVYPPSTLPGNWEVVGGADSGDTDGNVDNPGDETDPDQPVEQPYEWPAWVQPTGGHDAYAKDAKVSHNGKRWVSTADNNVWEPGAYGWAEQA